MKRKATSIIIQCLMLFLPLANFAVEPTSIVFIRYQENYTIQKDNKADVVLTISTEKPLKEKLIFPLAINNIQNAEVQTANKNIEVSLITIHDQVYLEIKPNSSEVMENHTIVINLLIADMIKEDGFFFRNKLVMIPLISNYPSNSKNNVFIDAYTANITIPESYKLEQNDIEKSSSDYKIYLNKNELIKTGRILKISSEYLNLHSIKHATIKLSGGFNPLILMGLIAALLVLYFIYFSSLIKHKDPVKNAETRYFD